MTAAVISGLATIVAAVIAYIGNERRRQTLELLAKSDGKRSLPVSELEQIYLHVQENDPPTGTTATHTTTGPARVKAIYPGSDEFRSYSTTNETTRYSIYENKQVSLVSISFDGEQLTAGNGEQGFTASFDAPLGRHTLTFRWTGKSETRRDANTPEGHDREYSSDINGRRETVFWVLRGGPCVLHLSLDFEIDHVEPNIILPTCTSCRMPGVRKCRCGRRYCVEHAAVVKDQEVCSVCKDQEFQKYLSLAKWAAIAIALFAGFRSCSG